MAENNDSRTHPGVIDVAKDEGKKGTAAANPILVVTPHGEVAGSQLEGSTNGHRDGETRIEVKDTRSPAEIEADLDRTREHLSSTLDELSERLSPRDLLRRGGLRVKYQFVSEGTGELRKQRVAALLGSLGVVIGGMVALHTVRGRAS
ncbi:MAG TPA: DUF3618 domain-containing protein [Actinocrinis sp.]|uniref:DUF3618 domain-containing protein n=1 Tax=Actinocrinis sp. TaxID=1920516 RepID=UPI002D307722|nr:DUF3618 domain-containing protein [Actinocrinis sp.]HZU55485.1 DUF3618 domain-containing protein [Actinocrinis sp.]